MLGPFGRSDHFHLISNFQHQQKTEKTYAPDDKATKLSKKREQSKL